MKTYKNMDNPFENIDNRLTRIETTLAGMEDLIKRFKPKDDDFLSVTEAASFVNLKPSTLYKLVSSRKIPFHKPGKQLYFKPSELRGWIELGRNLTVNEMKNRV